MSLLTRPSPTSADDTAGRTPLSSPVALGALAAVQSVVGSLLCVVGPVVGIWIASTRTGATWPEVVRVAADAWLLAHHTPLAVTGGHLSIVPLGLSLLPAAWCWTAGRRMALALGLHRGSAVPARAGLRALTSFTVVYALLAAVTAFVAAAPVARPGAGRALLGAAVLAVVAAGLSLMRSARGPGRKHPWTAVADRVRVPAVVRRMLPAAGVALAGWLAAAAFALAIALGLGWEQVLAAHRALDPGPVGGLGLVLAQVALAPNLVLWTGSWLAGPGIAVGTGTTVTPWTSELGAVPALPVLGALPTGDLPGALAMVLLVPVAAGALGGVLVARRHRVEGWLELLRDAAVAGVLAGAAGWALAALAAGAAGPGRMAEVGPSGWQVGLALAAEVAVGCAAGMAATRQWPGSGTGEAGKGQLEKLTPWLRSRSQRS